jgi:hypothetical protein
VKAGVQTTVLFDVFVGDNASTTPLMLGDSLISAIRQHPPSNNLMFGWLAANKSEPCHLKKVVLLLVATKIQGLCIHFQTMTKRRNILLC